MILRRGLLRAVGQLERQPFQLDLQINVAQEDAVGRAQALRHEVEHGVDPRAGRPVEDVLRGASGDG